jgi:flagellin
MAMTINTNVVSLNAQRNLGLSGNSLGTTMQRLSSGLRINSAKDDAAGLAIAERMNAQAKGLAVAARNANDGISLAQTAEGALGKMGDMLQRMRELAVQSSNATNSADDRKALQAEVNQLRSEIDRVAKTTTFNGQKILDGSFSGGVFQVGAGAGDNITVGGITNAKADALANVKYGSNVTANVKASSITNLDEIKAGTLSLRIGSDKAIDLGAIGEASTGQERLGQVVAAINNKTADTGVTAFLVAGKVEGDYTVELRSSSEKGVSLTGFSAGTTGVGLSATLGLASAQSTPYDTAIASIDKLLALDTLGTTISTTLRVQDLEIVRNQAVAVGTAFAGSYATDITSAIASYVTAATAEMWLASGSPPSSTNQGNAATTAAHMADGNLVWERDGNAGYGSTIASITNVHTALETLKTALQTQKDKLQTANLKGVTDDIAALDSDVTHTDLTAGISALEGKLVAAGVLPTGGKLGVPAVSATSKPEDLKAAKDMAVADANYLIASGFGIKTAQVTDHKGVDKIDIGTQAGAWEALKSIDSALDQVNAARGTLGALQTRFEKTVENIDIMNENISAARGRIVDADFASETANLSRAQILQQAGTAMVAQANQLPQNVLSLLR